MLDEKDLQAIQAMMDASEQRMTQRIDDSEQRMTQKIDDSEQRIMKNVAVLMENQFQPRFDLLAENQQIILQKLVPRSRVDELEDEVKFMKLMLRQMAERISDLEKAN